MPKEDGAVVIKTTIDNKKAQAELNRFAKKIDDLNAKIKRAESDRLPWLEQAEQLGAKLDEAKAKLEAMRAAPTGTYTAEQIAEQAETVKSLQAQWDAAQNKVDGYDRAIERSKSQLNAAEERAGELAEQLSGVNTNALESALSTVAEKAKSFGKAIQSKIAGGFKTAANLCKKLGANIASAAKKLNVFGKITGAIQKKISKLGMMIRRVFIFSVITSMLRAIRTEISKLLSVNTELQTALGRLKGALLTAIEPIYSALVPVLTQVIELLTRAAMAAAQFTAALFGTTAKQAQKNAKALYEQTEATEQAGKAADKASKSFASFDEVEQLTAPKNTTDSADASAPIFDFEFDDTSIYDKYKELLDKLKDLWADGEYFEFGKTIAESLNDAAQSVDDWINNVFRPNGVKWAGRIADILNGMIEGWNAKATGKTLADGLNAILDIANTFLKKFDAANFGKKIGEAINGFFSNVDWKLLSDFFSNGWNDLIDIIYELINTVKWGEIGENIGQFLSDAIAGIDWEKTGKTLASFFLGIADFIIGLLGGVNWGDITSAISSFLIGAMDEVSAWLQSKDWVEFGNSLYESVKSAIEGVDFAGLADSFFELLGSAFGAAVATVGGILDGVFDDLKAYFEEKVNEAGGNIPKAFLQGILDGLNIVGDIENWIKEHIATPFYEGMLKTFGVEEGSSEMKTIGGLLSEGFVNGIIQGIPWLREMHWIKEVFGPIIDAVKILFGVHSPSTVMTEIGEMIGQGLVNGITSAIQGVKDILNAIITAVENAANWCIDKLNLLSFDVPDWVPLIGGETFGINIPKVSIPRLAAGAVIPPNREFMAVLGDQTSGTNIEAPEALLRQMAQEAANANTELLREILQAIRAGQTIEVDRMPFGRVVRDAYDRESARAGASFVRVT